MFSAQEEQALGSAMHLLDIIILPECGLPVVAKKQHLCMDQEKMYDIQLSYADVVCFQEAKQNRSCYGSST